MAVKDEERKLACQDVNKMVSGVKLLLQYLQATTRLYCVDKAQN